MKLVFTFIGMAAGLVGIIFHDRLAKSMMKYYEPASRPRALVVMRVAYILIGLWMFLIGAWILYRRR
jgi:uncharacterized membrane protein